MKLRILVTGGTFDKEYDEITGRLFFRTTHLEEMLSRGRSRLDVVVETIFMMDSLEMGDGHRDAILAAARDCAEERLVVTHGTDTMVDTAAVLARGLDGTGKTVVLTGAMIPWAFGSSDGLFNLGSALSFAQALGPGVWIAMNGRLFAWNDVKKNRELGVFEALS